jgi:hypothetical protein
VTPKKLGIQLLYYLAIDFLKKGETNSYWGRWLIFLSATKFCARSREKRKRRQRETDTERPILAVWREENKKEVLNTLFWWSCPVSSLASSP